MAGYIGIQSSTPNSTALTNLISNGSLASNTTSWTMASQYDVTQGSGFVTITENSTVNTSETGTEPCYQVFTSVSGSTSATNKILYAQATVCDGANNSSYPRVYFRRYKNGSSSASYGPNLAAVETFTRTCNFTSINMSSLPSGGYAYATINDGTTHYTSGSISISKGDKIHIYLDRTSNNGNAGVYLYRDKGAAIVDSSSMAGNVGETSDMPDYHEWSNSLSYTWDSANAPYDFKSVSITFENESSGYLNCYIKLEQAWVKYSSRTETYDGSDYYSYNRIAFGIYATNTVGDTMSIKNIIVVNLTNEFGSGNEPSKTWCDENIFMDGNTPKYITGYGSKAKTLKNIYFGVGGVAKKVKKAYIGVNGIAKLWYGELAKLYAVLSCGASSDALSTTKYGMAAGSVGDYAIFAGGSTNMLNLVNSTMTFSKTVDAYNSSLVHSSLSNLSSNITYPGVVTLGNQMIIAGGMSAASNGGVFGAQKTTTTVLSTVKYYNGSAISSGVSSGQSLSTGRVGLKGDTIGSYGLFAGGNLATNASTTASFSFVVEAYTSASVKTTSPSSLQTGVSKLASCHSDDYVIFAGGIYSGVDPQGYVSSSSSITGVNYVTAYNTSLVKTNAPNLTYAECYPSAARAGNYLLVAERDTSSGATESKVNVYDGSTLSKSTAITLSENKNNVTATTINNCAYFFGGWKTQQGYSSSDFSSKVDGYTPDLVHFTIGDLSEARMEALVATAGDYTYLAGGKKSGSSMMSFSDVVDVYKNTETPAMYITSAGSTEGGSRYYSGYININSTSYSSVGEVTINAGDSLTVYAKSGTYTYYDSSSESDVTITVYTRVRVNGSTVLTAGTSTFSSYSLGTVSSNTAYNVKLVSGRVTSSSSNAYAYIDIYTRTGLPA